MKEQNEYIITNGVKRLHISIVNNEPVVDRLYVIDRINKHISNCLLTKDGHIKYKDIDINILFFSKEYPSKFVFSRNSHLEISDLANVVLYMNSNFGSSLNMMRNTKYMNWIEETGKSSKCRFWRIK